MTAALERVPVLVDNRDVDVRVTGADRSGPPVVFASGLTGHHTEWTDVRALLPDTPLLSYGRPGLADSEPLPLNGRIPEDPSDVATHLHRVLRTVERGRTLAGPYVIVAHSIGGWFADRYAAEYPDRVAALVLIEPTNFLPRAFEESPLDDSGPGGFRLDWTRARADLQHPLPPRPTAGAIVISTSVGAWVRDPPSMSCAPLTLGEADALWQRGQRAWAARYTAAHVIAQTPLHLVQRAQPLLVAACVTAAVSAARSGTPLALDPQMVAAAGGTLVAPGSISPPTSPLRRGTEQQ